MVGMSDALTGHSVNRHQAEADLGSPTQPGDAHSPTRQPDSEVVRRLTGSSVKGAAEGSSFRPSAASVLARLGGQSTAAAPSEVRTLRRFEALQQLRGPATAAAPDSEPWRPAVYPPPSHVALPAKPLIPLPEKQASQQIKYRSQPNQEWSVVTPLRPIF